MVREAKKCRTYCTVRTAYFTFSLICLSETAVKQGDKIKLCAIREKLHRRKYRNHHSVIYETVKPIHGNVAFLPVRSALTQKRKADKVLLWTRLRRAKSEKKLPSSRLLFGGKHVSPHSKPISRICGGIFI